jgi:hypothetical protein
MRWYHEQKWFMPFSQPVFESLAAHNDEEIELEECKVHISKLLYGVRIHKHVETHLLAYSQ